MESIKNIWLVNYYAMPPELESRLRTIKFAQYLKIKGYNVKVIASSAMHNKGINLITDNSRYIEKSYDSLDFVHIKTPNYKSNGIARLYSLFIFHFKLHLLRNNFFKPDLVIHIAYPPLGFLTYYTARKFKAQYIVEVLDLWPESFITFGLIRRYNPLLHLAYLIEKWTYQNANKVVFSMEGGKDYIINKKWNIESGGKIDLKKIYYINNGVDLDDFYYFKKKFRIDDNDLNSNCFKVIYLGSIRLANNLIRLINAAKLLINEDRIKFIIYGDGEDRLFLENYCKAQNISNIFFKDKWVDPKYVPYILSSSNLNILNYMPNSIFRYGGSQSKLFQYLASGRPICSNIKMGYCLINKYKLGIAQEFKSDEEYANAIKTIFNTNKEEYDEMCARANLVAKFFDYKLLTNTLIDVFTIQ